MDVRGDWQGRGRHPPISVNLFSISLFPIVNSGARWGAREDERGLDGVDVVSARALAGIGERDGGAERLAQGQSDCCSAPCKAPSAFFGQYRQLQPDTDCGRSYGEPMAVKRARWEAAGDCRDCGAKGPHRLPDGTPSKRCARCRRGRGSRTPGSGWGKRAAATVAVTLYLPVALHRRIREDAEARGESVEAWLLAAARESFEPEPEGAPC